MIIFIFLCLTKNAVRPKSCYGYFMVLNTLTEMIRKKNRIEGMRIQIEPNRENPEPFQP